MLLSAAKPGPGDPEQPQPPTPTPNPQPPTPNPQPPTPNPQPPTHIIPTKKYLSCITSRRIPDIYPPPPNVNVERRRGCPGRQPEPRPSPPRPPPPLVTPRHPPTSLASSQTPSTTPSAPGRPVRPPRREGRDAATGLACLVVPGARGDGDGGGGTATAAAAVDGIRVWRHRTQTLTEALVPPGRCASFAHPEQLEEEEEGYVRPLHHLLLPGRGAPGRPGSLRIGGLGRGGGGPGQPPRRQEEGTPSHGSPPPLLPVRVHSGGIAGVLGRCPPCPARGGA